MSDLPRGISHSLGVRAGVWFPRGTDVTGWIGGVAQFKAISMAYEILSDEQKRKTYDEGGLEALESGGGGGGEAGDIFSAFFGGRGGGGRGRRSGPRKGEDLVHPISVPHLPSSHPLSASQPCQP